MSQNYFSKFYGAKSKFVYYNSLQQTHEPICKQLIADGNFLIESQETKMKEIASTMRGWAYQEGIKEIALLKEYFNISSLSLGPEQMYTNEIGKQITDAINGAMQLRSVYERHLKRIVGPTGRGKGTAKITGAQFFAEYFSSELGQLVEEKYKELNNPLEYSLEQLGEQLFSDEIIQKALYRTLFIRLKESRDWSVSDDSKGYQELFTAIESFNKNGLMQEISRVYKLDELKIKLIKASIVELCHINKTNIGYQFGKIATIHFLWW